MDTLVLGLAALWLIAFLVYLIVKRRRQRGTPQ